MPPKLSTESRPYPYAAWASAVGVKIILLAYVSVRQAFRASKASRKDDRSVLHTGLTSGNLYQNTYCQAFTSPNMSRATIHCGIEPVPYPWPPTFSDRTEGKTV